MKTYLGNNRKVEDQQRQPAAAPNDDEDKEEFNPSWRYDYYNKYNQQDNLNETIITLRLMAD